MSSPMRAQAVLDRCFLEMRCKALEIAASLDRIDHATGAAEVAGDPRLRKLQDALRMLTDGKGDRARRLQMIFSDSYDPAWQRPARG